MIENAKVVTLLADIMDRVSQLGEYPPHVEEAVRRSVRRANIPEVVMTAAMVELAQRRRT